MVPFSELVAKNKNGKAIIKIKEGQNILPALKIPPSCDNGLLALVSADGRLLIASLSSVPEMTKGKGGKLISLKKGSHVVTAAFFLPNQKLILTAGRKKMELLPKEYKVYRAELGSKGEKLPKGFDKIQHLLAQ